MSRTELHLLREGDRFRLPGVSFRADSVGPNAVMATVLSGEYRGARPGQTTFIATGGPRHSLWVDVDDDMPEPPRAA